MTHKEIRQTILDAVYRHQESASKGFGLASSLLKKQIGVDIDFDVYYLKDKGLLKENGGLIKLTADGIDEVENADRNF